MDSGGKRQRTKGEGEGEGQRKCTLLPSSIYAAPNPEWERGTPARAPAHRDPTAYPTADLTSEPNQHAPHNLRAHAALQSTAHEGPAMSPGRTIGSIEHPSNILG